MRYGMWCVVYALPTLHAESKRIRKEHVEEISVAFSLIFHHEMYYYFFVLFFVPAWQTKINMFTTDQISKFHYFHVCTLSVLAKSEQNQTGSFAR
jgi:hypothetical protein